MTSPDSTEGGDISRRIASTMMYAARPNSTTALAMAARISARAYPNVRRAVGGRAAKYTASSDSPIPAVSAAMCAASASSTREPVIRAPTISAAAIRADRAMTVIRARRYRPVAVAGPP
jgi:hypothetical protein